MVAAHQSGEALRLPSLPTMYSACLGRVRVRVRVRVRIRVRVRVRIRVRVSRGRTSRGRCCYARP